MSGCYQSRLVHFPRRKVIDCKNHGAVPTNDMIQRSLHTVSDMSLRHAPTSCYFNCSPSNDDVVGVEKEYKDLSFFFFTN
jgi:hypothetical protein